MRASACSSVLQAPTLANASKRRFDASLLMVTFMFVFGCRLSSFEASCPSLDAFFVSIFPPPLQAFFINSSHFFSNHHHHLGDANNMIDHATRTATPDTPPLGGPLEGVSRGPAGEKRRRRQAHEEGYLV